MVQHKINLVGWRGILGTRENCMSIEITCGMRKGEERMTFRIKAKSMCPTHKSYLVKLALKSQPKCFLKNLNDLWAHQGQWNLRGLCLMCSCGHRDKCWLTHLCRKDLDSPPMLTSQEVHALRSGESPLHLSVYTEWNSPAPEHLWAEMARALAGVYLEPTASGGEASL